LAFQIKARTDYTAGIMKSGSDPGFPSVKRQQVIAFLEEAKLRLTDDIVRDTIEKTRR